MGVARAGPGVPKGHKGTLAATHLFTVFVLVMVSWLFTSVILYRLNPHRLVYINYDSIKLL